ncbi:hypothetical protein ACP4OV_003829 [Aristida adscensionis]
MEIVISAVVGDLVTRCMSFLINKCKSEEQSLEEKMERLQDLLIRVHTIVQEAEGRYITNSRMLLQLKKLVKVMYQGYHVMDAINYGTLQNSRAQKEVSSITFTTSISQPCSMKSSSSISHNDLQGMLRNIESTLSNMTEFVSLLRGCERMFRGPYDTYLYLDNFMFGRQVEKQQIINVLLQDDLPSFTPTVLPVIGGIKVGKKTLVAYACNNEKVRSRFSSILHMNGENIGTMEQEPYMPGRSLVVVELTSDIDDQNWEKFYSSAKQMGRGSKIIIISRMSKVSRFGTVNPIRLNSLSPEECNYLFKALAFGSTNPGEHPRLASVAKDLAEVIQGSFVAVNVCADVLRKNQNVHFWISILKRYRSMVQINFSVFGEHPNILMCRDHPIDITRYLPLPCSTPSSAATYHLMPPHFSKINGSKRGLPKVLFGDLISGLTVLPKEFELVAWESRIAPYERLCVNLATCCNENKISQHKTASPSKKRQRLEL